MPVSPKVIAFYLPQFHCIPENDKWWGKNYTEWVATKKAESLFYGHAQPNEPLNDNYYDLLEKSTMQWQANLMKQYNVYGLCFYHYWFKNGKKVLEKPAENLLQWNDIDMPFCFSWANESWIRTWSNIDNGNEWAPKFENTEFKKNENSVLLEQDYGTETEWEEHFYYLLPFFKDKRYIKRDGKPVFLIYRPEKILCLEKMLDFWNKLAKKEGFSGVYFIGNNKKLDADYIHSPAGILRTFNYVNKMLMFNFNEANANLINKSISVKNQNTYLSCFCGFDDTPRRGNDGRVGYNQNIESFSKTLKILLKLSHTYNKEFVFLNAWNEWGEGMYLEPDKKNGYAFLEAVKSATENYQNVEIEKKSNKKYAVFGTGRLYESRKNIINNNDIVAFLDNDVNKHGKLLDGKKIYSPKNINAIDFDYVLIMSLAYSEMREELLDLGVNESKILSYFDITGYELPNFKENNIENKFLHLSVVKNITEHNCKEILDKISKNDKVRNFILSEEDVDKNVIEIVNNFNIDVIYIPQMRGIKNILEKWLVQFDKIEYL